MAIGSDPDPATIPGTGVAVSHHAPDRWRNRTSDDAPLLELAWEESQRVANPPTLTDADEVRYYAAEDVVIVHNDGEIVTVYERDEQSRPALWACIDQRFGGGR